MGLLKNLKKGLLTPAMIGLLAGMLIGLLNLGQYIPDFLMRTFESAGNCQGPAAMLLAGLVIGGYDMKELLRDGTVYIMTALRLIAIPAAMLLVMKLIGVSETIMTMTLVTFATPIGLNSIIYPAAYGGETKPGAAMVMISHVFCVATIPLMYLLFIGGI